MQHATLGALLGASLLLASQTPVLAETTPDSSASLPYVRKNASTPAALPDLMALQSALDKMRAMGCADPRSWYYQGATHAIPPTIPNGDNPLCPSYTNISQLKWGWNTCTHQDGSEIHFLLWHRLYIQHFESIVRQLSGKRDFALPYWDYTNTAYRVMPEPLRKPGSSLFTAERLPSLNAGQPIQNTPRADMNKLLDVTSLFQNRVFSAFSNQIDRAPHGAMHNYIGGVANDLTMWNSIYRDNAHSGLMGEVPSAGFDPVFWLHHANIDYLWQKWERSPNGRRPSLAELQAVPWPYQFFDANGQRVEYSVEQAYRAAFSPDYVYDQLGSPVAALDSDDGKQLLQAHARQQAQQLWQARPRQAMQGQSLDLAPPAEAATKQPELMANADTALVLQMVVSFSAEPDNAYEVLITDSQGGEQLAGYLTFFGAAHHASGHGGAEHAHGEHAAAPARLQASFLFDVTDELPADGQFGLRVKSQGSQGEDLRIEEISLSRF